MRIGISACLLGEKVRYDGGHRRDAFITGTLARLVEFVPVCPEVDIELGTPRETIRLERRGDEVRLVASRSARDHTARMLRYARQQVRALAALEVAGYIAKQDSPSCGMERVKIWDAQGRAERQGRGLFTRVLMERCPLLPVEEEGRLHDPRRRENFFERVFAYRRLRSLFAARWQRGDLVRFHAAERLLLLAHHPPAYGEIGRLVAAARQLPRRELAARYQAAFMQALAHKTSTGRHVKVLRQIERHLAPALEGVARCELAAAIAEFKAGRLPLIVSLTLLRHHMQRHAIEDLLLQTYLDPHPQELMLRYHV